MKAFFFILLSIFQLQYSWCSVVLIDKGFESIEFKEQYNVFIDSNNIWKEKGIECINNKKGFSSYNVPYLKYRNNYPLILKFDIVTSQTADSNFVIDFQHADIDRLQLLVVDSSGKSYSSKILGDKLPFKNRYKQYRFFAIPIKLKPNDKYQVYVALEKPNRVLTTKIILSSENKWEQNAINENISNGLIAGLFSSFIVIGLILFLILSQFIYLYYSAYALMIFLLLFALNGYAYQYFFPELPNLQHYFIILIQLFGLLFLNLYAFNFTGLTRHSLFFKLLSKGISLLYVSLILFVLVSINTEYENERILGDFLLVVEISNFIFLLIAPLLFYLKTKKQEAIVFFVSYSMVGISLFYATFSFIIPQLRYVMLMDTLSIGLFLEMLILSTYMIYSYKALIDKKLKIEYDLQIERTKNQLAFIDGQEQEKRSIALYLHDNISSQLIIALNKFKKNIADVSLNSELDLIAFDTERSIKNVNNELRNISHQLLPVALESVGLAAAISQLLNDYYNVFKVHFHAQDMPEKLPHNISLNIYRIVQELLKNALQHSNANNVYIQLIGYEEYFELQYEDDGKGINLNELRKGIGFRSIDFRVQLLNANIQMESTVDKGLFISIKTPF